MYNKIKLSIPNIIQLHLLRYGIMFTFYYENKTQQIIWPQSKHNHNRIMFSMQLNVKISSFSIVEASYNARGWSRMLRGGVRFKKYMGAWHSRFTRVVPLWLNFKCQSIIYILTILIYIQII